MQCVEMRGLRQANDQLTEAYVPFYFGYAGLRLRDRYSCGPTGETGTAAALPEKERARV